MDLSKRIEPKTWSFVEKIQNAGGKPIYDIPVAEGRAIFDQLQALPNEKPDVDVEDKTLPVGPGGKVDIRIVRPKGAKEALPVIMFFHGAGWVFGDYQTHGRLVREIAVGTHAAVVFVKYTLAPEAQYPTQIEESYAAMKYIVEHGKQFNLDTSRFVVAGDSVGGNMTSVMTLLAKERGGPKIDYQVLIYPVTDANFDNASYKEFAEGPWLTKKAMEWFWDKYLPNKEKRKEITASPLQASLEQLKGLPPALVITGECDVLRDEGEAYAHKLNAAGVTVTAVRHLGTIHDFLMLNDLSETPACRNAVETIIDHLTHIFGKKK
ncbi:TPA: alpha/beta hydrolase fold domain-containing protein [Legionella pneumophila]|uniref:alpha/beta hydrolase n=1 Tax=Legionella sp. PATHC039 TaxID=2992042 RepID=UPI0007786CEA|nr:MULTISPECIES: alpha/beta hydrolase [Legionella]HAT8859702.1 alpha/beta hydrolase fold domain-containing protein [Legionella pneumophila subsp. pneumophila]MCW8394653.1 alpha/beta hydrolase [Legionella sp. PATHC039]HAT7071982.1 alpha/beta hydrolase fold domain-containing protein [Legionella pneumophila]HAT8640403.1 alpha/beta hydrolase fold domain-containing protein [Legionella pneumophila]HAT8867083.1 alpha/beta hydrolase fold domain-containing protein [Legionella pneumophila subsp. pneumop